MTPLSTALLLLLQAEVTTVPLGEPFTLVYRVPDGFIPLTVQADENFAILRQNGDTLTVVPLTPDTLRLPSLRAVSDTVEAEFPAPPVIVSRTMPDTTWTVPVFTSPISMRIPPGLPSDYLKRHEFWVRWGRPPSRDRTLPAILAVLLVAAAAAAWRTLRKRGAGTDAEGSGKTPNGLSPLEEVEALLESRAFAEGNWKDYYEQVDRLLRDTLAFRFGITSRALTWNQLKSELSTAADGRKFMASAEDLVTETLLQRYASWGGSRERAGRFTRKLLELRREWHTL